MKDNTREVLGFD